MVAEKWAVVAEIMGIKERKARHRENTRQTILDAARRLFVAQGYDAVSLRKIAEEIEYSPGTIYLHFKDKDEILIHLFEEGFTLLKARLDTIEEDAPLEWLRKGGRVYLDFAVSQPHYYDIMFRIAAQALGGQSALDDSMGPRVFGCIRRAVHDAIARGQIARGDGENDELHELLVSHTIWAGLHGAASLTLSGMLLLHHHSPNPNTERDMGAERAAFLAETVEMILRGLPRPINNNAP